MINNSDIKEQILHLVGKNPKNFSKKIKKDQELCKWVETNTKTKSENFSAKVYSAIYEVSDICPRGNLKKFDRWSTGFTGCGPARSCECVKEQISKKVSKTKQSQPESLKDCSSAKRAKTMLSKYGVEYNSQRSEVKSILQRPKISQSSYDLLSNYSYLHSEYVDKNRSAVDIADELGVYYSTVLEYCKKHGFEIKKTSNSSLVETKVLEYVKSLSISNVLSRDWSALKTRELDIYLPEYNFAIEVNGLYWHSFSPTSNRVEIPDRHLRKKEESKSNGIELFYVTDWEWQNKKDIICSMIKSKLGKSDNILSARKCSVQIIDSKTAGQFYQENHLQSKVSGCTYNLALTYDDKIVMAVSIGKSRFRENNQFELLRLACKKDTVVVGGAERLFKHIRLFNLGSAYLITYCDFDKSSGKTYERLGFDFVNKTNPGYFWTDGTNIWSRYQTMKHKLPTFLSNYDKSLSESQNMFANNFRRYWNCGNLLYQIKL